LAVTTQLEKGSAGILPALTGFQPVSQRAGKTGFQPVSRRAGKK
jgi:hypothetical protein